MPRYHACWVSDEKAGSQNRPNILTFDCADDATAQTITTAWDALISGDLMSLTKEVRANHRRDTYPNGTGNVEAFLLIHTAVNADGNPYVAASEHAKFYDVSDASSVRNAINAYVAAHAGSLVMFRNGLAVTGTVGAKS